MNKLRSAGLIMLTLAVGPASAADLTCPTASPSHDWKGFRMERSQIRPLEDDEAPNSLGAVKAVSVFDGSPTEMADLVPDNPDSFGKAPLVWSLPDGMKRVVWVVCRYKNGIAFGRALPSSVRMCSVEGGPGKVFKIRCK